MPRLPVCTPTDVIRAVNRAGLFLDQSSGSHQFFRHRTDGGLSRVSRTSPGWYLNLKPNADCEIWLGSKRMCARARTAGGDERTWGWKKMAETYPPYDEYQKRAGSRQTPVVVLEPTGPA